MFYGLVSWLTFEHIAYLYFTVIIIHILSQTTVRVGDPRVFEVIPWIARIVPGSVHPRGLIGTGTDDTCAHSFRKNATFDANFFLFVHNVAFLAAHQLSGCAKSVRAEFLCARLALTVFQEEATIVMAASGPERGASDGVIEQVIAPFALVIYQCKAW